MTLIELSYSPHQKWLLLFFLQESYSFLGFLSASVCLILSRFPDFAQQRIDGDQDEGQNYFVQTLSLQTSPLFLSLT